MPDRPPTQDREVHLDASPGAPHPALPHGGARAEGAAALMADAQSELDRREQEVDDASKQAQGCDEEEVEAEDPAEKAVKKSRPAAVAESSSPGVLRRWFSLKKLRLLAYVVTGIAAGAVDFAAVCTALEIRDLAFVSSESDAPGLLEGLLLHVIAVSLCLASVFLGGRPTGPEVEAVLYTTIFVPFVGPALAWGWVMRPEGDSRNAHVVYEEEEDDDIYQRSALTGNWEHDLSRELSTVSFTMVLRQGSLERRRNLLTRLAQVGDPLHVGILRRCLHEAEPELRLCAYAELASMSRRHEERIAGLRRALDESIEAMENADSEEGEEGSVRNADEDLGLEPLDPLDVVQDARLACARACYDYAASGVLDPDMGSYFAGQAVALADEAFQAQPGSWRAVQLKALALTEIKDYDAAASALATVHPEEADRPELALTRAEIAARARDFEGARREAAVLAAAGVEIPTWLSALGKSEAPRAPRHEEFAGGAL